MTTYDNNPPYVVIDRYSDLEATSPAKQQTPAQNTLASNPANGYAEAAPEKGYSRPFGLGTLAFIAIVAVLSALVVGGAIGGGLGATLASCENDKKDIQNQLLMTSSINLAEQLTVQVPTATATATAAGSTTGLLANYAVIPATNVYNVSFDCAELAKKVQTTVFNPRSNQSYKLYCGRDFGTLSAKNSNGDDVPTHNLLGVIQYNLAGCLEACSSINRFVTVNNLRDTQNCRSVTFTSRMHQALSGQEANCWLKNGTPSSIDPNPNPDNFFIVSAALQE